MSTISALFRKVKESEGFTPLWLLLGPVFLLGSTALAIYSEHTELVISAVFGLLLSARFRIRGFFYGIALLAVVRRIAGTAFALLSSLNNAVSADRQ